MERWSELEALFDEALELDVAARPAFLEALRAREPELHVEIVSLLASHEEADDFFEGLAERVVSPLFERLEAEPPVPERVGAYRVVREIGRGGMSTVYLAERADGQFDQQVALKLIRDASRADDRLRRFLDERQILASLNHPNVARLLDGGVTEIGLPYFAMEYVEGEPIDRYCDARRLPVEARLRLFLTVVEAVQYAHRNLIVHRDLKPSNILVTPDGTVKLLDFGIAKLLDTDDRPANVTQTSRRWMTPEYAAPEQVRGDRVTTATDVYQLGVVLYRLLTGHRPYRITSSSSFDIERAVCDELPTRPSMAVVRTEEMRRGDATVRITPESVSQTRDTELQTLRRKLSGDLDAILLKTLRKEPEARFVSAEALGEDVRRFLDGRPVEARRGSLTYRARKYVLRNRWGIAAAAVILVLLAGYAVTATLQAREIARERDRARLEAAQAEEVTELMVDLFKISDPNETQGDTVTARQVLARAAQRVQAELVDQPDVQSRALGVIGRVYEGLGLYDDGVRYLRQAVALQRKAPPQGTADLAEMLQHLGTALKNAGAFDEAESTLRDAEATWEGLPGHPTRHAESMVALARLLADMKQFAPADSLYRQALVIQRRELGARHPDVAKTLSNIALLQQNLGNLTEAESLYRETLAMQQHLLGNRHTDVATTLINLAGLHGDLGHFARSDSLYQQALGMLRAILGDEHPDVAKTLNNLGLMHLKAGNIAAAERYLRQALRIKQKLLGDDHPSLTYTYINLSDILRLQGELREAEEMGRRALEIDQKVYGPDHPEVATDLSHLALIVSEGGGRDEADALLARATTIQRAGGSASAIGLSTTLLRRGVLWMEQGRAQAAEPLLREALAIRTEAVGGEHWGTAQVLGALGACLTRRGRWQEAEQSLLESYRLLSADLGAEDTRTERVRTYLAGLYDAWGKAEEAARYRTASARTVRAPGP